jgi:hypothetical protein
MKPLTNQKIAGILLKMESATIPNQFVHNGVDFWPYIKISIIGRLRNIHVQVKHHSKFVYVLRLSISEISKVLKALYRCRIVDAKANLKGNFYPTMILAPYEHRYEKTRGGCLNKHADAIRGYCDAYQTIGLIEYNFSSKWGERRASDSHILTIMPSLLNVKYCILSAFRRSTDKWSIETNSLNNVFKSEGIGIELNSSNLFLEAKRVWEASLYCKEYLMRYQVKHLINIVYSNYIAIGFVLAARQLGIKTTEYQHGSQNDTHPIYTGWTLIDTSGYQLLPENYWVWSLRNQQRIQQWAQHSQSHNAKITGNFYINPFLSNNTERVKSTVILLTLQDPSQFPVFMYNAISNSPKDWIWWIKEHPRYKLTSSIWKRFEDTSAQIFDVSDEHLYTLFSKVTMHVTGYSTCAFEAEIFNLPTVFFDETARFGYQELIANYEHFVFASDENEVVDSIIKLTDITVKQSGYIEAASYKVDELLKVSGD